MIAAKLDSVPVQDGDKVVFVNWRLIDGSSHIERIGWPCSGEPLMLVQFSDGTRYGYWPVTRQQAVAAANAKSVGKFLHSRIYGRKASAKIG